jgi:hypothetical protein
MFMEKKFQQGEVVYDRTRPTQKLIVKRFSFDLYYCQPIENKMLRQLVFMEREIERTPSGKLMP